MSLHTKNTWNLWSFKSSLMQRNRFYWVYVIANCIYHRTLCVGGEISSSAVDRSSGRTDCQLSVSPSAEHECSVFHCISDHQISPRQKLKSPNWAAQIGSAWRRYLNWGCSNFETRNSLNHGLFCSLGWYIILCSSLFCTPPHPDLPCLTANESMT